MKHTNSADLLILGLQGEVDEEDVIDAASDKYFKFRTYFLNYYPVVRVGRKRIEKIESVMRAKFNVLGKGVPTVDDARSDIELPGEPTAFLETYEAWVMQYRLPIANSEDAQLIKACLTLLDVQKEYNARFERVFGQLDGLSENVERLKISEQVPPNELLAEVKRNSGEGGELPKVSKELLRVKDLLSLS